MRLDKYLSELNIGTRSQVKEFVRRGQVCVNGEVVKTPEQKIDEKADRVTFRGQELFYTEYVYYMMNKPQGVVSATEDNVSETVLELLRPYLRESDRKKKIFPAGRLDKDVTGLLLLTNDGGLAHELLSPARHVEKTYRVLLREALSETAVKMLEHGVDIGEARPTKPAVVTVSPTDPLMVNLRIHEGKYHQVKRMFRAVGNEVVSLSRVSFGGLTLDETLQPGECRELAAEEVELLRSGGK